LIKDQLAQLVTIASSRHPSDQIVFAARGKRQNQQVLGFLLPRQSSHDVGWRYGLRLSRLAEEIAGDVPNVFLVVEDLGIAHVKDSVRLGLRPEKRFGIAGV